MGRFEDSERGVSEKDVRLTDVYSVEEQGVEVAPFERDRNNYPDLQPWLATFADREDVIDISDPLFPEPYLLKKGQLEHELLQEPAVSRLNYVDQFGWRHAVLAVVGVHPHTRGEHSLAAEKIIVEKMADEGREASELLRIAAITHDIGQPAFSHHGEAAFDSSKRQNWHDQRREDVLRTVHPYGLADFLDRHEISVEDLMAEYDNPLLDVERPDLCADRIEYLLRDGITNGDIRAEEARLLLADTRIVFKDDARYFKPLPEETALTDEDRQELSRLAEGKQPVWVTSSTVSAEAYYRLMERLNGVYTGAEMGTIKMYTSRLLRIAMEREYISPELIQTSTDDLVMYELTEALRANPDDEEFRQNFEYLVELGVARPAPKVEAFILGQRQKVEEFQTPDTATTKQRWVDPYAEGHLRIGNGNNGVVPVIRRLSYFKKLGYQVEGDGNANEAVKAVALRLRPQKPTHKIITPELTPRPKELEALRGELPPE